MVTAKVAADTPQGQVNPFFRNAKRLAPAMGSRLPDEADAKHHCLHKSADTCGTVLGFESSQQADVQSTPP